MGDIILGLGIGFIVCFGIVAVCIENGDLGKRFNMVESAIEKCEEVLPRNQKCDFKIEAFPVTTKE